ncbi:MAG TPA: hypothetical protein VJ820_13865, partial [Propionibacteriaceae bacterium]|nr:hypothetical protein [Propionibacteriaceae bacterium]
EPARLRGREKLRGDIEWARHYMAPWLGKGIRGIRQGRGIQRKRPFPDVMPKSEVTGQKPQQIVSDSWGS